MNLNKSTRYALYAAMEMARGESQVTVVQVAKRYRIPETVLAKVFQQLVRSGIAIGTRGTGGGYRLVRPSSTVTVLDVLNAFEPYRSPDQCLLADRAEAECADFSLCRLRSLFDEVDEQARATFASVSLETLVGRGAGGGEAKRVAHESS